MKDTFFLILQRALNRYLALDPETPRRLEKLKNKVVTLELMDLDLSCQFIFTDETIALRHTDLLPPDTVVRGTPLTLMRMSLTRGDKKHFFVKDVSLQGNLELGQALLDLFSELEIDWEEYASHWIGDMAAYQLGRLVKKAKRVSQHSRRILRENMNEYLHEEANWFPPLEALHDYFADVDDLLMDVDRLAARVDRLKNQRIL